MIVRFDSKKLQSNTTAGIGTENDLASRTKGAISEVEMIIGESKKRSGVDGDAIPQAESEHIKESVMKEIEEEETESGPEMTPEGSIQAQKLRAEQGGAA